MIYYLHFAMSEESFNLVLRYKSKIPIKHSKSTNKIRNIDSFWRVFLI